MTMLTLAPPTPVAGTAGVGTDQPALGITAPARTAGPIATARAVAGRTTRRFVRTPQLLVVSTISGAMFLLIFRYVFGGAINTGSLPYVDFLVPGYLVTSVLFTGRTPPPAWPRTWRPGSRTGSGRCPCPGPPC